MSQETQRVLFMEKDLLENVYRHYRYRFFKLSILPALLGL